MEPATGIRTARVVVGESETQAGSVRLRAVCSKGRRHQRVSALSPTTVPWQVLLVPTAEASMVSMFARLCVRVQCGIDRTAQSLSLPGNVPAVLTTSSTAGLTTINTATYANRGTAAFASGTAAFASGTAAYANPGAAFYANLGTAAFASRITAVFAAVNVATAEGSSDLDRGDRAARCGADDHS